MTDDLAVDLIFLFDDPQTTDIYTLSLHDALPISPPLTYAGAITINDTVSTQPPLSNTPKWKFFTANRSEEHTSELQSRLHLVCRLLLEKKKEINNIHTTPPMEASKTQPVIRRPSS